jgi:DnaJ-class molecular chaperone
MARDLYDVLGVKRDATEREIRTAFRRLARRHHPDVNPGNADAEARFKEINAAYEVLSDTDSRKKYDRYGDQWQHADQIEAMRRQQGAGFGSGGGFGGPGGPGSGGQGPTFEFDLGNLAGRGGGIFDSLFRRSPGRQRGEDVEHLTTLTLEDAYGGTVRTIEVHDGAETCRICGGSGQIAGATCHACRGTGNATPLRRIEVTIPAGIQTGQRIRVAGRGGPGANGGPAGDLYLVVEVRPHPRFERRGDDLHVDVDVPVADAALGGEVHVPTLKGRSLALRVPAGTQGGKVFRLAGQGMPRSAGGFGDLHARVRLVLPDPLTADHRVLFERLRATTDGTPPPRQAPAGTADGSRSAR